ncbi:MAG TPA: SDR family oxidoreductase [Ignavibacteria bacterium]|nr:SDR family oxidoreductase [Ignavibacteria bacterium]HRB00368.1 SDR family oxidoreductase [Ignavibacteria bacterium]
MKIKDSRILITGGSSGIGKAAAVLLSQSGAKVAITGRDKDKLDKTAEETGSLAIHADVSNEDDIKKTYEIMMKEFGGLDCLVNNAGIGEFPEVEDLTMEAFQNVYSVNVFGAALMTKHAADIFKKQNYGNIINIASTAALKGFARGTIYSSSKFALRGMNECWQAELRPHNIRVMLVNPSEVTTAFANKERKERDEVANKLTSVEIAHTIKSLLEMDDRGMIPEVTVWATNPWDKK